MVDQHGRPTRIYLIPARTWINIMTGIKKMLPPPPPEEGKMQRRIRLHENKDGQWTFQNIHENGEPGTHSEPYDNKSNARRGAHDEYPEDELEFFEEAVQG